MERLAGFAQKQCAGLGDRTVREAMAERLDIVCPRWNTAAVLVEVRDGVRRAISRRRLALLSGRGTLTRLRTAIIVVFDPDRLAEVQRTISRTHRDQQAVDRRLGLSRAILKGLDLLLKPLGLHLDFAQPSHQTALGIPRLPQTLFKCCYKVFVEHL